MARTRFATHGRADENPTSGKFASASRAIDAIKRSRFIASLGRVLLVSMVAAFATEMRGSEPDRSPNLLKDLLVIEAENCVDTAGTPIAGAKDTRSTNVFYNENRAASDGGYITPVPNPYRIYKPFPKPVEAVTEVTIPTAGRWFAHVRYMLTPEKLGTMEYRKATENVKHFHAFGQFQVTVGQQRFTVGAHPPKDADFAWEKIAVDLPAGRTTVKFSMPDMAAPDCIVLTSFAGYTPDVHDYEGPVWLRFKVTKGPEQAFFLQTRCFFNALESKQPKDAGWLFNHKIAATEQEAAELRKDSKQLLNIGQWSPWLKTFTAKKKFFYAETKVIPGAPPTGTATRKQGLDQIELTFQAATRPDESFLVHEGTESTGSARGVYIVMPTAHGVDPMRASVRSFSEWADDRLERVMQLGVQPGEGPRRIKVLTMDTFVKTPREIDAYLETCRLLGYNGFDINQQIVAPEQLWQRVEQGGFTWAMSHHVAPIFSLGKWLDLPASPPVGTTMQQVVDAFWYDQSLARVHMLWDKNPETHRRMVALANLVDEPGPTPKFFWANCVPAVKRSFHDFLRVNGVEPEFLGKKHWDDVLVVGYHTQQNPGTIRLLTQLNIDLEFVEPVDPARTIGAARYEAAPSVDGGPTRYRVQVPVAKGLQAATPEEKRQYYWSQRFRSFSTRHFYGQSARVVADLSKQGWFRDDVQQTPNFQAAPMMEVQMWDGGLNLFEWAREGTSNCLMVEDWINDHYRVGFGLALLDAAARKRGQSLGFLITADRHFRPRYLTGLAMGVRTFVDYLYGPIGVIGPAWADQPEGPRDRADMFRLTRRCEDDLLATRLRPADTALLVANSSEINTAFYSACSAETGLTNRAAGGRPLFRRAGIYAALHDANVPVEIVSEEEIVEDEALDRYKALYVTDTHVSSAVQEAIKRWVRNGGTLWADHTALARNEYDEDLGVMDEVFGLAERGPLPDSAKPQKNDTPPQKIHVAAGEQLEPVAFDGSLVHSTWKLSTGEALATFDDGSPALVLSRFGKGRAVLLGCSALMLSPYATQSLANPEFAKVRHVTKLGAELAEARQPCDVSVPRVPAFVRDGSHQTVLVLINATGAAQPGVNIRVRVPHEVRSAFDGRGREVKFTQKSEEVAFKHDLAYDDGDIVVFKW